MRDRHEEMAFIVGFFNVLRVDWLASTKSTTVVQWRALLCVAGTGRPEVRKVMQEMRDWDQDEEASDVLIPVGLWYMTRWICSLELPNDLPHLCLDPPVLRRTRPPRP
jgi:hypothetical protein